MPTLKDTKLVKGSNQVFLVFHAPEIEDEQLLAVTEFDISTAGLVMAYIKQHLRDGYEESLRRGTNEPVNRMALLMEHASNMVAVRESLKFLMMTGAAELGPVPAVVAFRDYLVEWAGDEAKGILAELPDDDDLEAAKWQGLGRVQDFLHERGLLINIAGLINWKADTDDFVLDKKNERAARFIAYNKGVARLWTARSLEAQREIKDELDGLVIHMNE